MDLEYYFRNEIDFRNLKSVANLLSTKFQCINKISFLQGKEDRQYILLFETDSTNSLDFISLSIMMDHGILEYQENRDILIKAKSTHYSLERSFIENWYVFRVDVDGYYLSHPSFEEKYDWEGFDALSIEEKVERINKGIKLIGRFLPPTDGIPQSGPIPFLNYDSNSEDFIDDIHWTLTQVGFEKFAITKKSIVLYQNETGAHGELTKTTGQKNDIIEKYKDYAKAYCHIIEQQKGQLPKKTEVYDFLEYMLKANEEKLGKKGGLLPDNVFRDLWKDLPKRKIGEKDSKK